MKIEYQFKTDYEDVYITGVRFNELPITTLQEEGAIPVMYNLLITFKDPVDDIPTIGDLNIATWMQKFLHGALFVSEEHEEFGILSQLTKVKLYGIPSGNDLSTHLSKTMTQILSSYLDDELEVSVEKGD